VIFVVAVRSKFPSVQLSVPVTLVIFFRFFEGLAQSDRRHGENGHTKLVGAGAAAADRREG